MEKFALLNLLKAIDGIKSSQNAEKGTPSAPTAPSTPTAPETPQPQYGAELPNIMYETLMRHEAVSNRLRNKK